MTAFYNWGDYMQNDITAVALRPSALFVEDDITFVSLMVQLLDKVNFAHAVSFEDALALAEKDEFDFIFLDLCLNDFDKYKTIENLGKLANLCDVIVLSGHGDELLAAEAIRNGAAGYLRKTDIASLNQAQILRIVRDILRQHRAAGKLKEINKSLKASRRDIEKLLANIV